MKFIPETLQSRTFEHKVVFITFAWRQALGTYTPGTGKIRPLMAALINRKTTATRPEAEN